jgi:hypothetical protein
MRFARFAHVISSTKPTAPDRTRRAGLTSPTTASWSGFAPIRVPWFSGCRAMMACERALRSPRAAAVVTSGFRRPTMVRK